MASPETPETEEVLVEQDSVVMLDHKDRQVPPGHLVHVEPLVPQVNLDSLADRVNVASLVLMDSRAELEILDQVVLREILVLLAKSDHREQGEHQDFLGTPVPLDLLASLDNKV